MTKRLLLVALVFVSAKLFAADYEVLEKLVLKNNFSKNFATLDIVPDQGITLKFVNATASADGLTITMNFDGSISGGNIGFKVHNTSSTQFSSITGWGSSTLTGTLTEPIVYGEAVNVSYKDLYTEGIVSGNLKDEDGIDVDFFLKEIVDVSAIVFTGTEKFVTSTATNGDGSENNPYSISQMVSKIRTDFNDASETGLRYNLKAGNYNRNVFHLEGVKGALGKPIIIEGYQNTPGDKPNLNWSVGTSLDPTVMPYFEGATNIDYGILVYNGSSNITLKNIQVKSFENSIYFNNVNYAWLDNVIVERSYNKSIQLVGVSKEGVISNSIAFNGNVMNFSINGDNHLALNNLSYCNSTSYVTDYYFSVKGKHHVLRNNLSHRIGDVSHNGHAMSIQTDAPISDAVDPQETFYNFVDGLASINIVKAIEFRHGGTRYNVARGINSYAVQDGGQNATGGVMFRDNTSENVLENSVFDTSKGSDGFGLAFVESVEIGLGMGFDNIVRNNIFKNLQFGIVIRNYNAGQVPVMTSNKIYNNTFHDIDFLFKMPNQKNGVSLPINIVGNEMKNNIFNKIPKLNTEGNDQYDLSRFSNAFTWDTNNFSEAWGVSGTNPNTADPQFINATNSNFKLESTSQLIDGGTELTNDVKKDFESKLRPQGSAYDIGAYEFRNSFTGSVGPDFSICNGETATLTASGGTTYLWNTGETTESINVTPSETTTYSVTISDDNNTITDEIVVTVEEDPTISLGEDITICEGESVTLVAEGNGDFLWSNGETGSSIEVSPLETTTYLATASNSCATEVTEAIIVNVTPGITLTKSENTSICVGETITLTAESNGDYEWSTGESTASIDVSPDVTTTYTITTFLGNCSVSEDIIVTVNEAPSVSLEEDVTICFGQSITLTAQGTGDFLWSTGETTSSIYVSPLDTTVYSVTASNDCSTSVTDEITVNVTPDVTLTTSGDVTICLGESTTITANSNSNILWETGETTESIIVSPTETTTYRLTAGVGNCELIDVITVTVNQSPEVSLPEEDLFICGGETVTLTAEGIGDFLWSNGETTKSITVTPDATTTYTVTTSNSCSSTATDEIIVNVSPGVSLELDQNVSICNGESTTLTANTNGDVLWSTGETTASITVSPLNTTIYTLTSTLGGCSTNGEVTVTVNQAPTVNVGEDRTICEGETISLIASGNGNFLWSTGETTPSISVSPLSTTVYTVTSSNACNTVVEDSVVVNVSPNVTLELTEDTVICRGESIVLTANTNGDVQWSTGETTKSINVSPTSTTTYTVNSVLGECNNSGEIKVTVSNLPSVNLGEDITICGSESITLTAEGVGNVLWSTGETSRTIRVSPNQDTTYTVESTTSCGAKASDAITINVTPTVTLSLTRNKTICLGETVALTANTNGEVLWSTGEVTKTINVSPSNTTEYTVISTLGDCNKSGAVTVTIIDDSPSVDAGNDKVICSGDSVTLIAKGNGSFLWNTGATSKSITVNPTTTTNYSVEVTTNCGGTASDDVEVSVLDKINVNLGNDTAIIEGETITLTSSGSATGDYLWSTGETTASISVSPVTNTTYTLEVTNGVCSDEDSIVITVNKPNIQIQSDKDPDICKGEEVRLTVLGLNGVDYFWSTGEVTQTIIVKPEETTTYSVSINSKSGSKQTSSIEVNVSNCTLEAALDDFVAYPNPTESIINVDLPSISRKMRMSVISINGNIVYSRNIASEETGITTQIDLSSMPKGVYFIRIHNEIFSKTKKVLVI